MQDLGTQDYLGKNWQKTRDPARCPQRSTPGKAATHSSNSGVNQKRLRRVRRGQNRLRGSW
jgi:hypothetical protein